MKEMNVEEVEWADDDPSDGEFIPGIFFSLAHQPVTPIKANSFGVAFWALWLIVYCNTNGLNSDYQ